ncbi:protein ycf2, partial [Phtheirospermum japonicum]
FALFWELQLPIAKSSILSLRKYSIPKSTVAQDLWSLSGPDEKDGITSYGLIVNHPDLIHGLSEVKGALVGSSQIEKDCSPFENGRVILILRHEPRNPLDMI